MMPHFVYSSTYSIYAILIYRDLCFVPEDDDPDAENSDSIVCHFDNDSDGMNNVRDLPRKRDLVIISWIFLCVFNILYLGKEVNRILHYGRDIFKHLEFIIDLSIITSFICICPWADLHENTTGKWTKFEIRRWRYHMAALGGQ